MVIDKEIHKDMLLQLLAASSFPGSAIDAVHELKQSIETAIVRAEPCKPSES